MKHLAKLTLVLIASVAAAGAVAPAAAEPPRDKDEVALEETEANVLQIRRQLFQARQRNDQESIRKLEKKFKKTQDERVRLLRQTEQM